MSPPGGSGVRGFVAVLLPDALRERIHAAAGDLRRRGARVSWVRAENLHVTLRFLGTVPEPTLGPLGEALTEATTTMAPFRISLGPFGGFPSAHASRVVWVGVAEGADLLGELYRRIEAALVGAGFPREPRPFHPHVTLGRARDPGGASGLLAPGPPRGKPLGDCRVEAVHLMRSELHPRGAHYSVLAASPLGGGPSPRRVDFTEAAP